MTDPRRLLEDPSVSARARELLGSLSAPAPLTGPERAAIGGRLANSLAGPLAVAKVAASKAIGFWATIVTAGAAAVSLAVVAISEPKPVGTQHSSARAVPTVTAPPPRVEAAAPAPVASSAPSPSAVTPPAPSARPSIRRDTLALEESLLEQARRSIDSPAKALSLLREHERRFPNGELTAERLYLTAQTHARAGNASAAQYSARLLTRRFPKSTYVPRVRQYL